MRLAKLAQAGRAHFLAGLDQHFGIEAELAARLQDRRQRADIDAVLALFVGRAAAIEAGSLRLQAPGRQALRPLRILPADHVTVAVGEDGHRRWILDPFSVQEWPFGARFSKGP